MILAIGVDPGASGGLACVAADCVVAAAMPATERDVWDWFHYFEAGQRPFAVIEKVGGFVQGSRGNIGSAMFKFGQSYGSLRMALTAAGIPFDEVTPQEWQKVIGIPARKPTESKSEHKAKLRAKAQQLFPDVRVTLATADALLIAEYCRRRHAKG